MLVTVNTDASFSPQHKIGAYAFWIVCDQGRIIYSGPLPEASSSTDAEIRCIINALKALADSKFTNVSKIVINSDALCAFNMIQPKAKKGTTAKTCFEVLVRLRNKYNHKVDIHEFRHVKAHSGTAEKRKWVNDWCDKTAKKILREKVKTQAP